MKNNKQVVNAYCKEFKETYLPKLNETFLGIVMSRQTQFVGTKTLAIAFKYLGISMKFKESRLFIKPSIETILFNISLPLFVTT